MCKEVEFLGILKEVPPKCPVTEWSEEMPGQAEWTGFFPTAFDSINTHCELQYMVFPIWLEHRTPLRKHLTGLVFNSTVWDLRAGPPTPCVNWPVVHSSQVKWGQIKEEHRKHVLSTQCLSRTYWKDGMFSSFSIQNAVSSPLVTLVYGSTRALIQPEFNKLTGIHVLSRLTELLKKSCTIHVCTQPRSKNSSELFHWIVKVFWFGVKNIQRRKKSKKRLPLVCHRVHHCTFREQMITNTL